MQIITYVLVEFFPSLNHFKVLQTRKENA